MRNYLVNKTQYYLGYQIYHHQLSVHRNIYIYTICTLNFTLFMYTEKRQYIIFFFLHVLQTTQYITNILQVN